MTIGDVFRVEVLDMERNIFVERWKILSRGEHSNHLIRAQVMAVFVSLCGVLPQSPMSVDGRPHVGDRLTRSSSPMEDCTLGPSR